MPYDLLPCDRRVIRALVYVKSILGIACDPQPRVPHRMTDMFLLTQKQQGCIICNLIQQHPKQVDAAAAAAASSSSFHHHNHHHPHQNTHRARLQPLLRATRWRKRSTTSSKPWALRHGHGKLQVWVVWCLEAWGSRFSRVWEVLPVGHD